METMKHDVMGYEDADIDWLFPLTIITPIANFTSPKDAERNDTQ